MLLGALRRPLFFSDWAFFSLCWVLVCFLSRALVFLSPYGTVWTSLLHLSPRRFLLFGIFFLFSVYAAAFLVDPVHFLLLSVKCGFVQMSLNFAAADSVRLLSLAVHV